ncbi:MAG: ATP synthase subunit b [Candidatus Ordinivivax streblomastigis]|uniref:ATP synthase subunit b n=1 Tax=Candidatus Ordinivivax streblomastigis TaxID=2540710 RepID=A0A5M8P184_9BACT|nr:MAG: ATP synthase subunit b [Candidatus Ordinivivax streblomastigis]
MSLLTPDIGLLFWMLLSFGIVFFVLAKFGFPIIVKMVDERKNYIDQSLEAAKQANTQLLGIKEESEKILTEARNEQIRILKEANEMRQKVVGEAKEQAQMEAAKVMEDAKRNIEREKMLAMRDAHSQIAMLSITIAEKILRKNLENKSAQLELVEQLIDEVQKN